MAHGSDEPTEAAGGELVRPGDPESMREWAELLVTRAREEGVALTGEGGLLTDLMRHVLQTGLEVEMADHLGYGPHAAVGRGSGNSRNGAYDKTVTTEIGEVELRVPRDREGTFEPGTVPKYQRRLEGLSGNVISLYAKGLTTGEIQQHLAELYGTRGVAGHDLADHRPDRRGDAGLAEPPTRPGLRGPADRLPCHQGQRLAGRQPARLCRDRRQPRGGARRARAVARPLGRGGSEAVGDHADRAQKPRSRRRADRLLRRAEGLARLDPYDLAGGDRADLCACTWSETACATPPRSTGAGSPRQMREIYTAPTVEAAEARFAEFAGEWRELYPAMISAWESVWEEFVPFLAFPAELRKIVYTTNAVESLNARFRRAVRHRGHFPTEQAALKVLYLVATQRRKNRQDMTGTISGWKQILNTLHVHYGDRITG